MLQANNIVKTFGANPVLKGISFKIAEGEIVGLIGPGGGGKSVLLKILGKVMEPDRGELNFERPETRVGFLFQESALFDSLSVIENTAFPLLEGGLQAEISREEALERSFEVLKQVGLDKAIYKLPGQLSGGMRRRAGIARALVSKPELLLLDDPTGGLDPVAAAAIMNLVLELHESYKPALVMVSHDLRRLIPRVERLMALFGGKIVADFPTDEMLKKADEQVLKFISTRYDLNTAPAASSAHA